MVYCIVTTRVNLTMTIDGLHDGEERGGALMMRELCFRASILASIVATGA